MTTELEKKYLNQISFNWDPSGVPLLIVDLIVVCIFILVPAIFLLLFDNFPTYNLFAKIQESQLNGRMEFIRHSVWISAIYATYMLLLLLISALGHGVVGLHEHLQSQKSYSLRRRILYLENTRHWLALSGTLLFAIIWSASILYKSSFLDSINDSNQEIKRWTSWALFERIILVIFIFVNLWTLLKFMTSAISYHFLKSAYLERVVDSNFKFGILTRLYLAVIRGIPKPSLQSSHYSLELFTDDKGLDLNSSRRVEELSRLLFENICPRNRQTLKCDDFSNFFNPDEVEGAFQVFDALKTNEVDQEQFYSVINQIFIERRNIKHSSDAHKRIIAKLETVLLSLTLLLTYLAAVVLFKLQTTAFVVTLGFMYGVLAIGVISGVRAIYDSLHFIFVVHAFDVGDHVRIESDDLIVSKVDIFTTIFRKWDNTAVFIPNTNLCTMKIENISRSKLEPEKDSTK